MMAPALTIFSAFTLAALGVATVNADAIPRSEAEQLWARASRLMKAQVRSIHSLQGRYTTRIYDDVTGRKRDYRVEFAFEDGMLLDSRTYTGKTYQIVETEWVGGGGEMLIEHASPGGKGSEVRTRDNPHSITVGRRGDAHLLSCSLPHDDARYLTLHHLFDLRPQPALVGAERLADGHIRFELTAHEGKWRLVLTCDESKAYMAEKIEEWTSQDGPERRFRTTTVSYASLKASDGSTWYYPIAGQTIGYEGDRDVWLDGFEVDVSSLVVNADIPDAKFLMKPREDEALIRDGDWKVLQPPRVPASRPALTSATDDTSVASGQYESQGLQQPVYGGGRNWWWIGGLSFGVSLMVAGAFIVLRRKGP